MKSFVSRQISRHVSKSLQTGVKPVSNVFHSKYVFSRPCYATSTAFIRSFHAFPSLRQKDTDKPGQLRLDKPSYQLSFTCKKCNTRSSHNVTKQAYHNGTALIQCPGCKNRHLIADHLKIFSDNRITLEDILKAKGQNITKGTIDIDQLTNGDLELEQMPESLKEKLQLNDSNKEN